MVLSLLASCKNKDKIDPIPTPEPQPEMSPIEMSATTQWYGQTKGVVTAVSGLYDEGFTAWGTYVDSDDIENDIFGTDGTKVSYQDNVWTYSPLKYWHDGMHHFFAIRPAMTYTMTSYPLESSESGAELSVVFPGGGFQLKAESPAAQTDLMVAYNRVDHDGESSTSPVSLTFNHQLAVVNFLIKRDNSALFTLNDIVIYGNSTKATSAVFTAAVSNAGVISLVPEWTLDGTSNSGAPFYSSTDDMELTETATACVSNLLVFPEQTTITIAGHYTEVKSNYYQITDAFTTSVSVDWQANTKYTYTLSLTSHGIVFSEPTVEPWVTGEQVDGSIEM